MSLLDQSSVTGGLDPYNVHVLFVNMDNMWMERFGNYNCLVLLLRGEHFVELHMGVFVSWLWNFVVLINLETNCSDSPLDFHCFQDFGAL